MKESMLIGFVDPDYVGDQDKRISLTRYVFELWNSTISWKTTLESVVPLVSIEAKYIAYKISQSNLLKGMVS